MRHRGEVVTGTVVAADTQPYRHPQGWIDVEYVTLAGEKVVQRTGRFKRIAVVGDAIEVRYDRKHPHQMQDTRSGLGYAVPLGVSGTITAGFLVLAARQLRRRHETDE